MGRPTKLTPDLQARVLLAIRAGNYAETAAAFAGLSRSTFYEWARRGAREIQRQDKGAAPDPKEAIFAEFHYELERAMAEAEVADLAIITKASEKQWQAAAWRRERMQPDKWGRRERHGDGPPGDPSTDSGLKDHDAWMESQRAASGKPKKATKKKRATKKRATKKRRAR